MKKSFVGLLFFASSMFALTGQEVYETNCASCHLMKSPMDKSEMMLMREKMQSASPEEKAAMKKKMKAKMEKLGIKAPPMAMVSKRLKKMTGSKEEFVAFVSDYIVNPSQEKGFCMPMAYKRFGTMPAIGKGMNKVDVQTVSVWLHDHFTGTWGDSMETKACDSRNGKPSKMKCGGKK